MRGILWAALSGAVVFLISNFVVGVLTLGFNSWWYTLCPVLAGCVSAVVMTVLDRQSLWRLFFGVITAPFILSVYLIVMMYFRDDYFAWLPTASTLLTTVVGSLCGGALVAASCFRLWFPNKDSLELSRYGY